MSALQIVGTLLAVPVGIGSAYSMYRANFSVETTCQSLRGNIVAMLDKRVDASTRHMLVRRDVEAFESTCGTVDPDATAAFKALLAADKKAAPLATATARPTEPRQDAVLHQDSVPHKAAPRPDVAAKQPESNSNAVAAEAAPVQHEAASDVIWVAAVRHALAAHAGDPAPSAEAVKLTAVTPAPPADNAKPATVMLAPPAAPPALRELRPVGESWTQPMNLAAPSPISAPALPPAMSVAIAPARPADDGHPVPPASIPEMASAPAAKAEMHTRSRLGDLVAQIPVVGWAFDR